MPSNLSIWVAWYDRKLFRQHGWSPPGTWSELDAYYLQTPLGTTSYYLRLQGGTTWSFGRNGAHGFSQSGSYPYSDTQWVKVELGPEEFPGYKGERVVCEQCGEGINFCREVRREGKVLCRACAGESYYTPVAEK